MAWGYWSATSVSDRGRSPRREKDKQHQSLYHQTQQAQQQMHQAELSAQATYATVQELGVAVPGMGIVEEPPCSMMIQGGSFYSYSAATAAAAMNRRISTVDSSGGGPSSLTSTGIQVLPRERHVRPGTSTHPPSPGSDSAEYEQPLVGHLRSADISPPSCLGSPPHHHHYHHHHHHDDIFAQPGTSSRVAKLLPCSPDTIEGMDELSEAELEEVANAELIYGPTATCRVHGPCSQQPLPPLPPESSLSMTSLFDIEPAGPSQFQFNEITWGRCSSGRIEKISDAGSTSLSSSSSSLSCFFNAARDLGQSLFACLSRQDIRHILVSVCPVHFVRTMRRTRRSEKRVSSGRMTRGRESRRPPFGRLWHLLTEIVVAAAFSALQ